MGDIGFYLAVAAHDRHGLHEGAVAGHDVFEGVAVDDLDEPTREAVDEVAEGPLTSMLIEAACYAYACLVISGRAERAPYWFAAGFFALLPCFSAYAATILKDGSHAAFFVLLVAQVLDFALSDKGDRGARTRQAFGDSCSLLVLVCLYCLLEIAVSSSRWLHALRFFLESWEEGESAGCGFHGMPPLGLLWSGLC